jgi:hypothetical protein
VLLPCLAAVEVVAVEVENDLTAARENASAPITARDPHSTRVTTRIFGNAERLPPEPAYPKCTAFAMLSGTSHSNPSIETIRRPAGHAPFVIIVATGCATCSNTSRTT